jgi:hypothetical protein
MKRNYDFISIFCGSLAIYISLLQDNVISGIASFMRFYFLVLEQVTESAPLKFREKNLNITINENNIVDCSECTAVVCGKIYLHPNP